MESPRKFNDCYFYYYSTCTKGDNCVFRHEPLALGCETMCSAWQQGKCLDKRCKLRHMELRKNRKQIPCYWETQPGGCRKKHCPFMHKNPDLRTDGIAPSQPGVALPAGQSGVPVAAGGPAPEAEPAARPEPVPLAPLAAPLAAPLGAPLAAQQLPALLWQHQHPHHQHHQHAQRPVVLDSSILGVLPPGELGRRLPPHHPHEPPYPPLPIDPLVVNFEEESDNESAPSSTPTKNVAPDEEERELALLERIQAEAAAFYNYQPSEPKVKVNLSLKYDRVSLDEITGRPKHQTVERQSTTDFKVLSLEEIRARRKTDTNTTHSPITLNLRKRKLSTQETVTNEGEKIIKVVRSNSIVYKKVETNASPACAIHKEVVDEQKSVEVESRKRTISEVDIYDFQDDELVDNCYEFKKIKIVQTTSTKPRLIRHKQSTLDISGAESNEGEISGISNKTDDSDNEIEIVSVELPDCSANIDLSDSEVIEVDTTIKISDTIDLVDLSEELDNDTSDFEVANINVPDVVASCQKKVSNSPENNLLKEIDSIIDDNSRTSDNLDRNNCDVYDSI